MRRLRAAAVVAFALAAVGCRIGPRPESIGSATVPQGVETEVFFERGGSDARATGELVEMGDDALLLLIPGEGLTRYPYALLDRAEFSDIRGRSRIPGRTLASQRERLARFARYPFGLTDELLQALLRSMGQDRIREIES